MTVPTQAPPPGWYDDNHNPSFIRYWDGQNWSAQAAPKPPGWGQPSAAPVPAQPRARRPWWRRWWVVAAALIVLIGMVGSLGEDPSSPEAKPSTQADTQSAGSVTEGDTDPQSEGVAEPTEAEVAEPEPAKAVVPDVVGLHGKEAERALVALGLVAYVVREVPSPRPAGTVLRQLRATGVEVREGASIGLVVAKPYPLVPGTAGMSEAAATQRLRNAGFKVEVTREVVTSGRDGVVLRQSPVGSQRAKPHSVVTIVVASVVRPVAPAPSNCTPGYRPCLPPAPDYDCEGGSGDGPAYTGFVYVTGPDIYELDRDGDGRACES